MNISEFNKCSNCGACYNICPFDAIKVRENSLFYIPIVDQNKCVNCGMCSQVCPVNNEIVGFFPKKAYGGWHKDENVLMTSSSGGVFYGIAQVILSRGGVVYSAAYSDDCKEIVFKSTDQIELGKLQKSKYVESKVLASFKKIKVELESGRYVLFCGTPCQVAGLKQFLRKDYLNLIACDFVCGGLPSHKIYVEYLKILEKKYKSRINRVDFRPKTHGWKRYAVLVEFENGKKYNALGVEDPFLRSFLYGKYTVRDYCLECKFSDMHMSDVTIADFWMHNKVSTLVNDDGISLVLCNTNNGEKILEKLKSDIYLEKIELNKALYNYKTTVVSDEHKKEHERFLQETEENNFLMAYKIFFKDSWKTKVKNRIARSIFRK